jgi:hypothetical protein
MYSKVVTVRSGTVTHSLYYGLKDPGQIFWIKEIQEHRSVLNPDPEPGVYRAVQEGKYYTQHPFSLTNFIKGSLT